MQRNGCGEAADESLLMSEKREECGRLRPMREASTGYGTARGSDALIASGALPDPCKRTILAGMPGQGRKAKSSEGVRVAKSHKTRRRG